MRRVIFAIVGLLAVQAPALAATPSACQIVGADWRAAAFSSPAKPAQARVLGSAGYETTGAGYRQIAQAIHHACDPHDPTDAARQAAVAETLLHGGKGGL